MGQHADLVSASPMGRVRAPLTDARQLVHAQVPHTEGETDCRHQDLPTCLYHSWHAKPHCSGLRRRAAGHVAVQEEAVHRGRQASLDAHVQDPQQRPVPDKATV